MKYLKQIPLNDIVFIDIETVRIENELIKDSPLYESWEYKMRYSREADKFDESSLEESFNKKAALYAEFGKIVCITIGKIDDNQIKLKSYYSENEKELLEDFSKGLNAIQANNKKTRICGHAIKGFDIPFIIRRFILNRLEIPDLLDVAHLKPWELTMLDTMELWKGTGFYGASLLNIATAFGLKSPKSDIDGSETSECYYKGELERIKEYCERDVATTINIYLGMINEPFIEDISHNIKEKEIGVVERLYNSGGKLDKDDEKLLLNNLEKLNEEEKVIANTILKTATPKKRTIK